MTEPTDHRAEAEKWLEDAREILGPSTDYNTDAIVSALIGIGHALLALTDAQATSATTINLTGNATREQIRDALRQTQAAPPLSPSEG